MQAKLFLTIFLVLSFNLLPAQTYTDIVQLTVNKDIVLNVIDLFSDGEYKYLTVKSNYGKKGDGIYFNNKRVIDIEENHTVYTTLVLKINKKNEYVSHIKISDGSEIKKIKLIDGEYYYLIQGGHYKNIIRRYDALGVDEVIFEYSTGDRVKISDFLLADNTLILAGWFKYQKYLEIKGDTIWHPYPYEDDGSISTSCNFIYSIDMELDTVNYSFGYGCEYYDSYIDWLEWDRLGNMTIIGKYTRSGMEVLGDTLEYMGGLGGDDAYIIRVNSQGEKVSINTFSSISYIDLVSDILYDEDGSYYVSSTSTWGGKYSLDSTIYQKDSDFTTFHFLSKFGKDGELKWTKISSSTGGSEFFPLFQTEKTVFFGGDFYSGTRKLEIDGKVIDHEPEITNSILVELDKQNGDVLWKSDILSNGDDVRIKKSFYCEIGDSKSLLIKFNSSGIVLNGEKIPKKYNGYFIYVLANIEFDHLSVDEINDSDELFLYPNPVTDSDMLYIKGIGDEDLYYRVTDIKGEQFLHGKAKGSEGIDVKPLNSGVYYFEILGSNKKIVKPFIKF